MWSLGKYFYVNQFFFRQAIVLKSLFSPSFFDDRDKGEGDTVVLHSKHRTTYFVKTNLWMVEVNAPSLGTKCKQMPCGLPRSSTVFDAIHITMLHYCLFVCLLWLMAHPWVTCQDLQMLGGFLTVVCFLCFKGTQDPWNASTACLWHMRRRDLLTSMYSVKSSAQVIKKPGTLSPRLSL